MKKAFFILCSLLSLHAFAGDDPKALIRDINKKFSQVSDYKADVLMLFDIPGVKMNKMNGKVIFKRPNQFKIKAKGIFFLPKQNPMQNISTLLLDTSSYTSVITGYEVLNGVNCAIVNIIPLKTDNELILGKFWIDKKNALVLQSQITTKSNGTIEIENSYGANKLYALPEKIVVKIEVKKLKVPKMMAIDLNKKSKDKSKENVKESGSITLLFSNYKINTKFADAEFAEKE